MLFTCDTREDFTSTGKIYLITRKMAKYPICIMDFYFF